MTNSPGKTERSSTMVYKNLPKQPELTLNSSNLNKIDNKQKRSMMGSSLINAAMNDV